MGLVQNRPFFNPLFLGNIGQENVFYDTLQRKKLLFRVQEHKVQKSRKMDIVPMGLVHGFGPQLAIFQRFLFRQYIAGKCFL